MQDVLLVLETSCVQSSVAAWSGESLLCQAAWRAERNHSSAIFKAVRQVLDALEGRRLKEIVVGSGPGAYGGIRVALAVAAFPWCTVPAWRLFPPGTDLVCIMVRPA